MKVMKANYPSGIVLKQSGLFANIRRRACWERRVSRLSDNPLSTRLPTFSTPLDSFALKLVNRLSARLRSIHAYKRINGRCGRCCSTSSPILNVLSIRHVRSAVQIELRDLYERIKCLLSAVSSRSISLLY